VILLTEAFPIRGTTQQAGAYFDQESDTVTPTVSVARSFPAVHNPSEVQRKCGVRGRTEHHERVSTTNWNKNPKEGRQACLRRGG